MFVYPFCVTETRSEKPFDIEFYFIIYHHIILNYSQVPRSEIRNETGKYYHVLDNANATSTIIFEKKGLYQTNVIYYNYNFFVICFPSIFLSFFSMSLFLLGKSRFTFFFVFLFRLLMVLQLTISAFWRIICIIK